MSPSERIRWRQILLLVPSSIDLSVGVSPPGIVQVRNVLSPPPAETGEAGEEIPAGWFRGRTSPTPPGLRAHLARIKVGRGRDALRVYLAQMNGNATSWISQLDAVQAGVQAARDQEWAAPWLVLGWRREVPSLNAAVVARWPNARVRWIETPETSRDELRTARAAK